MSRLRPTVATVDLAAIRHNVGVLRDHAGGAAVCAVVKADGYGHGAVPVARAALDGGATWLAVALVEEGEGLRDAGVDAPILLLSEPPVDAVPRLLAADLRPTVYSDAFGAALDAAGRDRARPVAVHLKVDTGMARVGVPVTAWERFVRTASRWGGVDVEGIWTHLACADEPDPSTTDRQLDRLDDALAAARSAGIVPDLVHAANTAATLAHPRARRDLVRAGIGVYGLSPSPTLDADRFGLRPALALDTAVSFAKRVVAGTPVSYGHTWSAPADGWLATLPVGYADGVPRLLSNRGVVAIGGRRRPVAGTVCMDQTLVWCGDDPVAAGDEVVLLGRQGAARVRAEEWAEWAATIPYEIATAVTARVPRSHRDGAAT